MSVALVQNAGFLPKRRKTAPKTSNGTLKIQALKHQAKMLKANKKFMLLVAGYGSGKSHTLHLCTVTDVLAYPGIKILILAPSYDLLKLNNVPGIEEQLNNYGIDYKFNKSDYICYLSNGSQIIFRSMDNPSRIVAFEVARTYIDEADVLPLAQMEIAWTKALGRTRQVLVVDGKQIENRVWAFSTPEGFKFCYKRWVKLGGKEYGMIQAKTTDNPFLPSDFVQSLRDTYPAQLIDAYLEGKFVNLTSGTVYYTFDREKHNSTEEPQPKETLYIGMDFNVGKQAVVVYVKRGENYHAVWEFKDLLDTPQSIELIKKRFPDNTIVVYPDSTGKRRNTTNASTGVSDISLLKKAGFLVRAYSTNPLVKDRVAAVNGAFEKGRLFVNTENCPELTECLEQQVYDVNGRPDKNSGQDHMNDAAGYPICRLLPITDRKAYLTVVNV